MNTFSICLNHPWSLIMLNEIGTSENAAHDPLTLLDLPDDMQYEIASQFSKISDLARLAQTCKTYRGFFKTQLDQLAVNQLLIYVVRGQKSKAEKMIKAQPALLNMRGKVTDYSGRTFHNITPFEYTLWALDRHMWETMLRAVREHKNEQECMVGLHQQYQNYKEGDGLTYELLGIAYKEKHYDFSVIARLKNYHESYSFIHSTQGHDQCWAKGVGGAQKLLPVHVVYEYCSRRTFNPTPEFTETDLPEKMQVCDFILGRLDNWFDLTSNELGSRYGILHDWDDEYQISSVLVHSTWNLVSVQQNIDALTALCNQRKAEYEKLASSLKISIEETENSTEKLRI